jgi:signal transduction histidine kinase
MPVRLRFRSSLATTLCVLTFGSGFAQPAAVMDPAHRATLDALRQRAEKHVASNLNRFGLEALRRYDEQLDSLSLIEVRDSLARLEQQFEQNSTSRHRELGSFQQQIDSLRQVKAEVTASYEGLVRKSGIAFLIWLLVVLVIIQFRKRLLGKASLRLAASKTQEDATRKAAGEGDALIRDMDANLPRFASAASAIRSLEEEMKRSDQDPSGPWSHAANFPEALKLSTGLRQLIQRDYQFKEAVHLLGQADDDEKEKCDINQLCEVALELCSLGYSGEVEPPGIQLTRDLEKNLPHVLINRRMVTGLLLDVLDNAFQAVVEKHRQQIKGYQAKVSISTRVLPRFVQVRVKDNGVGISVAFQKTLFEEFNTTRPLGSGAGLGLSESKRVLSEIHKGEIKIESDPGNGTDVYLKFFHV